MILAVPITKIWQKHEIYTQDLDCSIDNHCGLQPQTSQAEINSRQSKIRTLIISLHSSLHAPVNKYWNKINCILELSLRSKQKQVEKAYTLHF